MHQASRKIHGSELSRGMLKPCELYAAGKVKQKTMTKSSDHVKAKENCGRISLGIFTINSLKEIKVSVNKPHCNIMVYKSTILKVSYFL